MDPYSMNGNMMNYSQMNMQGQPPPNGQPPSEIMVPQFSFRTMLRFVTEMVAVIQGVAMIMAMVTGWLKDQRTGEPGPVGKFFSAVKKRMQRLIFGTSPHDATSSPFDRAWASAPQRPPLSWTQRIIGLYLTYAIILELKNYWQAIKAEQMARLRASTNPSAQNVPGIIVTPPQRHDGLRSESMTNNLLEFYVNKQRELYQQKKSQEEVDPANVMEMGGTSDVRANKK